MTCSPSEAKQKHAAWIDNAIANIRKDLSNVILKDIKKNKLRFIQALQPLSLLSLTNTIAIMLKMIKLITFINPKYMITPS